MAEFERVRSLQAFQTEGWEIESWLIQMYNLKSVYLSLPRLAIWFLGEGKDWLAQYKDNMSE